MIRGLDPQIRLAFSRESDLMVRHIDAVNFAMKSLKMTERARGVSTSVTRSVVARAYYSVDHDTLKHFCTVLRTGLATSELDEPIILLRDFLVRTEKGRSALSVVREQYGKTERALKAYLRGEKLARIYATATELFPLPEETTRY